MMRPTPEERVERVRRYVDRWAMYRGGRSLASRGGDHLFLDDLRALLDALDAEEAALDRVRPSVDHLARLAEQLREQGDVRQVMLTDEGVDEAPTLADELWLIAYNLRAALEDQ